MVMRHGVANALKENEKDKFYSLGCYFCNDVVAPTNVSFFRLINLILKLKSSSFFSSVVVREKERERERKMSLLQMVDYPLDQIVDYGTPVELACTIRSTFGILIY